MAKLIALLLLNTGVVYSSSDLFSSMSDMEELYQHESTISEQMTRHLKVRVFFLSGIEILAQPNFNATLLQCVIIDNYSLYI